MFSTWVYLLHITFFCAWIQSSRSHQLPKDFVRCRPTDDSCILKRANEIVRQHPMGYPELLLGPIDPSRIGDIKLNSADPESPVNLNLEMTDVHLYGYSNLTFTKFSGFTNDPKDIKIEAVGMNPRVILKSKYKIKGQLLILPINGEGDQEVTIYGLQTKGQLKPRVEVKNGKTYIRPDNSKLKIKIERMKINLTNLFNGDKALSESVLKVINDNWKTLWTELEPLFTEKILKATDKLYDDIFSKIPYDELFIIDKKK